jgi:ElaB/YqjD/DUF883 family membrane-anchored ribosome-binding protein
MPPRDPELPEGTDAIVSGASRESGTGSGFVAAGGNETGDGSATRGATDKLVTQVRDQVSTLRDQAGGKLRDYADDGKGKATGLLEDIAAVIEDAARSIDQRLGQEYGDYAHRASGSVSSFAGKVREKSVDELLDDTRSVVRKSPAVAIAAAAVVGFALMRVVRTGLEDVGAKGREKGRGKGSKKSGA